MTGDLEDRVDRAEHVGDVGDRDELGPLADQRLELVEKELASVADRCNPQLCASPLADHLPGDDVRVVLHLGDEDLVALAEMGRAIGLGNQVDRPGGAGGKDDLLTLGGVEEALRFDASALVGLGRALGEVVHAPVHVGVVAREEP